MASDERTAEDLLDWFGHPAGRAAKVARLEQLLAAEAHVALALATLREVVVELELQRE